MDLRRSSNSPLYLAPASRLPRSKANNCVSFNVSGISLFIILCAKPSTIAVLPTPGSPIKTGLFLVRLAKTCKVRLISSSLPITGSIFPLIASSVMSLVNLLSELICDSGSLPVASLPNLILFISFSISLCGNE